MPGSYNFLVVIKSNNGSVLDSHPMTMSCFVAMCRCLRKQWNQLKSILDNQMNHLNQTAPPDLRMILDFTEYCLYRKWTNKTLLNRGHN